MSMFSIHIYDVTHGKDGTVNVVVGSGANVVRIAELTGRMVERFHECTDAEKIFISAISGIMNGRDQLGIGVDLRKQKVVPHGNNIQN